MKTSDNVTLKQLTDCRYLKEFCLEKKKDKKFVIEMINVPQLEKKPKADK